MKFAHLAALAMAVLFSPLAGAHPGEHGAQSQIIRAASTETVKFGPDLTELQILIPNDDGQGTMSAGTERLPAKVGIPVHVHPGTEEFIYVVDGEGEVSLDGKLSMVAAGDMILVPPGTRHGLRNTGSTALKILWSYNDSRMIAFFREFSYKNPADRDARATRAAWEVLAEKYKNAIVVLPTQGGPKHD